MAVHKRRSFKEVLPLDGKTQQMHLEGIPSPANEKEEINNLNEKYILIRTHQVFQVRKPNQNGLWTKRNSKGNAQRFHTMEIHPEGL